MSLAAFGAEVVRTVEMEGVGTADSPAEPGIADEPADVHAPTSTPTSNVVSVRLEAWAKGRLRSGRIPGS